MAGKTINEICKDTGLSRFTLSHAAKEGWLGEAAKQSGKYWLIDDKHDDFKSWLQKRKKQQILETDTKTP